MSKDLALFVDAATVHGHFNYRLLMSFCLSSCHPVTITRVINLRLVPGGMEIGFNVVSVFERPRNRRLVKQVESSF
jgi:hypothetical protein